MTDLIHISLDTETWGLLPGYDLRSIGACVFDPKTGRVCDNSLSYPWDPTGKTDGEFYIATDNPAAPDLMYQFELARDWHNDGTDTFRKYPLKRDPQTVQWWADQSEEAQAAFSDPVDLADALKALTSWIINLIPAPMQDDENLSRIRIWSHGSHFDEPIMRMAYQAVTGKASVPWHYRSPRDTRTVFELAGMDPDTCLNDFTVPGGIHHHALHDAQTQARAICKAYERLGLSDNCESYLKALSDRHTLTKRVDELLEANNRYQQEGRDARAKLATLTETHADLFELFELTTGEQPMKFAMIGRYAIIQTNLDRVQVVSTDTGYFSCEEPGDFDKAVQQARAVQA